MIGFHGCDVSVRDGLLNRPQVIVKSEKPYDWLGHGIYFWENNLERAMQWAREKALRKQIKTPAVIGAILSPDHCLDLTDSRFIDMLGAYYNLLALSYKELGKELPSNTDIREDVHKDKIIRELDCTVIEFMHQKIQEQRTEDIRTKGFSEYRSFDSARGVFTEGGPAFPGAGIRKKSHIQLCIRNPNCIKGFFLPRKETDFD